MNKLVHFGAGNIGKALVAPIFKANNYAITFVDVDKNTVKLLNSQNYYTIHSTTNNSKNTIIKNFNILHLEEKEKIFIAMLQAKVITTSVQYNNLKHLVSLFEEFITLKNKNTSEVNIICVENGVNVSSYFKTLLKIIPGKHIAFVDCIADKICVKSQQIPTQDVLAEDFFDLSVNKTMWLGERLNNINYFDNLKPITLRKLWMLNSTHSLIAWLIWDEYDNIFDFKNDLVKNKIVINYMEIVQDIIANKFSNFSNTALTNYKQIIYSRFCDEGIIDSPKRVGRNFANKIGEKERFISLFKVAHDKSKLIPIIILLYLLNKKKGFDIKIKEYTIKNGVVKAIETFSNVKLNDFISPNELNKIISKTLPII